MLAYRHDGEKGNTMKINTNSSVCAAVALLNRFNWFDVTSEGITGKTSHFCATGIILRESGLAQFDRQFAIPVFSDDRIEEVTPLSKNKFLFLSKSGTVYTVEAKNKTLADPDTASGNKEDPASLIDWNRSQIDEAGNVLIVLDLRKLGHISGIEYSDIKYYIDAYLHPGHSIRSTQVCRTIYFYKMGQETYAGIYNLETEQPITKRLFDAEYYDIIYCDEDKEQKGKIRQMMKEAGEKLGEVIPLF